MYRLEKGEIKKIETLERLAQCLNTTVETLLGVGMEYYPHASGFFERMRQLEEGSTRIYSHFEPFSYLLTSEKYDAYLQQMLLETDSTMVQGDKLDPKSLQTLAILSERKSHLNSHLPQIHNLIGIQHIEKFIHLGLVGSLNISPSTRMERVLAARQEVKYLLHLLEEKKDIVQVAITKQTISSSTFQIFYNDSEALSVASSPFRLSKVSAGIVVLTSVQNFGYYGIMIWMPSFLSKTLGFNLTKSAMWTSVTILGMIAGIWVFGQRADRIGRKPSFLLFQVGAVVMVLTYSQLTDPMTMLWAGALLGVFVNGMMGGYGAVMSEAYPTNTRATAQNLLFNVGRAVGGFGPVVIGAVACVYSFPMALALLAAIYVLDILATLFLLPELKGKALE